MSSRKLSAGRVAALAGAGIGLGFLLSRPVVLYVPVKAKLVGTAPHCPWINALSLQRDTIRFYELYQARLQELKILQYDPSLDIQLVRSKARSFWIKRPGENMPGKELLAYLLAEHDWMAENNAPNMVRRGDYVLDCGAHVGAFTQQALELGAQTVVAIEPEPVNLECLRRNFQEETASGRVILVPKGVWDSSGVLTMSLGTQNSGRNTLVLQERGGSIQVPVTMIDDIVRDLKIPRVTYIKMDIEGAERQALAGAISTLRRFRPRLLVETNHLPDDMVVLPRLIRQAYSQYRERCGPCESQFGLLVPHVVFYE